jgi:uncharacterized protein YbjT (DUF2867 family)
VPTRQLACHDIVHFAAGREDPMILVTGAAGLNGSAVIREFSRNGHPVRALVRDRIRTRHLAELPGVEVVEGDMRRPETLGPALDGVDRALMISTADPAMAQTQCAFVDACGQAGVGHVVKFSGAESGVGFDAGKFRFTRMHEEAERYLEASGLGWTHLRPSQFMQVYLREAPSVIKDGALSLPLADVALAPIDVGDIAQIAFAILSKGGYQGRRFDMTGPEALTMTQVAERITSATGHRVRYISITPDRRRQNLEAGGAPAWFLDALDEQARERLRHPRSRVSLDAHREFGVTPTTFADFASRNAAAFGGNG